MEALLHKTPTLALASHHTPKHGAAGGTARAQSPSEAPDGPDGGKKGDTALRVLLVAAIALVLGGYAGGVYAFGQLCYPGASFLGADLSLMDAASAASAIDSALDSYTLTVEGSDFSWVYEPASASELIDSEAAAQGIIDENEPLLWPVRLVQSLLGQRDYDGYLDESTSSDLAQGFDSEAFSTSLTEAVAAYNETRTGAFDPTSAYDAATGAFTVDAARSNEQLDAEAVLEDALTAIARLSSSLELEDDHYIALANGASDEELQAACDAANALVAASLTLTLGDTEVATLDSDQLFAWISFADDLSVSLDTESLTAWATALAESLDTVGTERTYTRADGEVITISGGTWGWEVDVDSFVAAVQEAVASGQEATLAIPTTSEADLYTAQGKADWGAYIDVDISEQMARYYDADGNIVWESGVITGNTTLGNGTPTGIYYIRAKYKNITLRGRYDEETGEYAWETPVSYWMAFVGSSVGFHDATWQSSSNFGVPGANTWTGSHGCVNLPLDAAAELYDLVYVGLCVIVHD